MSIWAFNSKDLKLEPVVQFKAVPDIDSLADSGQSFQLRSRLFDDGTTEVADKDRIEKKRTEAVADARKTKDEEQKNPLQTGRPRRSSWKCI